MRGEVRRVFAIVEAEDAPYLYRYLSRWIEESLRGYDVARRLFEVETRRIAAGLRIPLGLRVVARGRA